MKMAENYPNGQKRLWEKEKLLVTSNFSFSHSVFKRLVSQGRQKVSLCGNGLKCLSIKSNEWKMAIDMYVKKSSLVFWFKFPKNRIFVSDCSLCLQQEEIPNEAIENIQLSTDAAYKKFKGKGVEGPDIGKGLCVSI